MRTPRAPSSGHRPNDRLQALCRGLQTLAYMNRVGVVTSGVLAKRIGLTKSTAHRILMVLTDMGFLRHDPLGHQYFLAGRVRQLSAGFRDTQRVDAIALPRMRAWTREHGLPLLLVSEAAPKLAVRASTDVYWLVDGERHPAGSTLPKRGSSEAAIFHAFNRGPRRRSAQVRAFERLGYVRRVLAQRDEVHISVPLIAADGLIACLSIRCSLGVMRRRGATQRWAAALKTLAAEIVAADV